MHRSARVLSIKLIIGLALIALLLFQGDIWRQTTSILMELTLGGFAVVLLVPVVLIWASCLKWRLLLRYRGIDMSLISLMLYYTMGYFFNNFLPSSVGGDVARSYLVGRRIGSQTESLAAVVLERLIGLLTLVGLAAIGFALTPALHGDLLVAGSIAIMLAGCAVLMALIWMPDPVARPMLGYIDTVPLVRRPIRKIEGMRRAMETFWGRPRIVGLSFLYSLLYHLLTVVNIYVTGWALGVDLDIVSLSAVAPIILVIAALPTTPGGIGVWEWAFSVLLLPIGTGLEQGLAIALVLRAQLLITSLLGGVLYLLDGRAPIPGQGAVR